MSEQEWVSYWITSSISEVDRHLTARFDMLEKLWKTGAFDHENENTITEAIHSTICCGAEIIALLSEHTYGDDESPWIRHRFQKLIRLSAFLQETLTWLLVKWRYQMSKAIFEDILQHALGHNARTSAAWIKAVEEATKLLELPNVSERPESSSVECNFNILRAEDQDSGTEQDYEWESEDEEGGSSCWETEEEWEEGYELGRAVDIDDRDCFNYQLDSERRHYMHDLGEDKYWKWLTDYDERYWSHVYKRIEESELDSKEPELREGKLRRASKAIATFLSYVV